VAVGTTRVEIDHGEDDDRSRGCIDHESFGVWSRVCRPGNRDVPCVGGSLGDLRRCRPTQDR
jgi:hypothetical protein